MCFDDHAETRARQDLLEAMSSCMTASALAPTPGISLELYEIAALRHHEARNDTPGPVTALTSVENDSGMAAIVSWIGKAVANVAGRLGRHPRPGGMPA